MRTLKSLNLSECLHISGTEMIKSLNGSGAARAQLDSLNLRSCIYVRVSPVFGSPCGGPTKGDRLLASRQDFAVFSFTRHLGETLRELDLTSCANLTDLSACSIAAHLRKLVVLRLARCKQITDCGLLGVAEATKNAAEQEMVRLRRGGGV